MQRRLLPAALPTELQPNLAKRMEGIEPSTCWLGVFFTAFLTARPYVGFEPTTLLLVGCMIEEDKRRRDELPLLYRLSYLAHRSGQGWI